MALKQKNRLLKISTPLGEDVLLLTGFSGREEVSRLFHYELELISDNNAISATEIVGKNVTFSIDRPDESPRYFNGFVSGFCAGDEDLEGRRNYRAEVVPWLWFLTRTSDCRIFQNKTVPEIVEQIFGDLGFSDYDISQIKGDHPQREYCVQYRETDFNFVSRLMEEEGIFYFFKHEDGKHTLMLADQKGAYADCEENEVDYPRHVGTQPVKGQITDWEHRYEFRTGKWSQTDYNFEDHPARSESTPAELMMTSEPTKVELDDVDKYEFYDYPGEYGKKDQGDTYTRIRMEQEEVAHDVVHAESTCSTFTPGGKFKINRHRSSTEEGKTFVITSIDHSATEPLAYETGEQVGEEYRNMFTCIPDSVVFRPERITPKPVVQGLQPAVVTGPAGEEIWPDKYGRVKVQFFWDREGKRDENTSCWVRVSQTYAGKNWGFICIPRIGQEVLVAFLEGDPDRPIITGRVYNADQMPPYELPANKTQSGFKSRSSKEGGTENFNEIRFEDEKGSEQLFIHAEKNQDIEVENDETHWVGNNQKLTVDGDRTVHVKGAFDETIDSGETRTVTSGVTETINDGETRTVNGGQTETINDGQTETINGGETRTVKGGQKQTVIGGQTQTITGGQIETITDGETRTVIGGQTENVTGQLAQIILGSLVRVITGGGQIFSPAGYKINAPADITNFTGISNQFTGLAIGHTGAKLENTGASIGTTGFSYANNVIDMGLKGIEIKTGSGPYIRAKPIEIFQ